jgi:hypothetical protein
MLWMSAGLMSATRFTASSSFWLTPATALKRRLGTRTLLWTPSIT